ncbi:MAG: DUF4388 domain-containing protein [Thermodesulfobacteria bacterium]|nr:DUF4388 domain-containing protein [Thermodesulfobacteriota bacterium]
MGRPLEKNTVEEIDRRVSKLNGPPVMEGELSDISLADILQLLANRQGRHVVEVALPHAVGKVYLEGQNLYHAEIVGDEEKEGFEAFRILVGLEEGHFEVRRPVVWPESGNLKGPVAGLLIEAVRQYDEGEEGTFFNEDLFEKAIELEPPDAPELEEPSILEKIRQKLPEVSFAVLLEPGGEVKEVSGDGDAEQLAGFVSYGVFQLREIGNLLGMGELKAFAISGKKRLNAGLVLEEKILGLVGASRKGLLWWSKKLLECADLEKRS